MTVLRHHPVTPHFGSLAIETTNVLSGAPRQAKVTITLDNNPHATVNEQTAQLCGQLAGQKGYISLYSDSGNETQKAAMRGTGNFGMANTILQLTKERLAIPKDTGLNWVRLREARVVSTEPHAPQYV